MENLISQIKSTFESITEIKEVFAYPLQGSPKEYPSIIFYPTSMDNSFETTVENAKVYNFAVFLVVNVAGKDVSEIYEEILPKIHDKVVSVMDAGWSMGVTDGHRVWSRLSTSALTLSDENNGQVATAEMNLQVRLLTNN